MELATNSITKTLFLMTICLAMMGCDTGSEKRIAGENKSSQEPAEREATNVAPETGKAETPEPKPVTSGSASKIDFKGLIEKVQAKKTGRGTVMGEGGEWYEVTAVVDNFEYYNRNNIRYYTLTTNGDANGMPGKDGFTINFYFLDGRAWEQTTTGQKVTIRGELSSVSNPIDSVAVVFLSKCEIVESTKTGSPNITADLIDAARSKLNGSFPYEFVGDEKAFRAKGKVLEVFDASEADDIFVFQTNNNLQFKVLGDERNWSDPLKPGEEIELVGGHITAYKDYIKWNSPVRADLFK